MYALRVYFYFYQLLVYVSNNNLLQYTRISENRKIFNAKWHGKSELLVLSSSLHTKRERIGPLRVENWSKWKTHCVKNIL